MNKEEFYVTKDGVSLAFKHFNNEFNFKDDKVEIKTTYVRNAESRFFESEESMEDWKKFDNKLSDIKNQPLVLTQYFNGWFYLIDRFKDNCVGFAGMLFRDWWDLKSFLLLNPQYKYSMLSSQVQVFGKIKDVIYPISRVELLGNMLPFEEFYISIDNLFDYCNLSYWFEKSCDMYLPGGETLTWGIDTKISNFNNFEPILIHVTVCKEGKKRKYALSKYGYVFDWEIVRKGNEILKHKRDIKQIQNLVDKFKVL